METEVQYPVRFKLSNRNLYEIDWRDIELAMERDPHGYTVPGDDPNVLLVIPLDSKDAAASWDLRSMSLIAAFGLGFYWEFRRASR